jgi:hypothetical protein
MHLCVLQYNCTNSIPVQLVKRLAFSRVLMIIDHDFDMFGITFGFVFASCS